MAQRACAAVQKTGKLEARARGFIPSSASLHNSNPWRPRFDASSSKPSYYGLMEHSNLNNSFPDPAVLSVRDMGMSSVGNWRLAQLSLLELAIKQGNWQVVGKAEAIMGDS